MKRDIERATISELGSLTIERTSEKLCYLVSGVTLDINCNKVIIDIGGIKISTPVKEGRWRCELSHQLLQTVPKLEKMEISELINSEILDTREYFFNESCYDYATIGGIFTPAAAFRGGVTSSFEDPSVEQPKHRGAFLEFEEKKGVEN